MKCEYCGNAIQSGVELCPACGARVRQEVKEPQTPASNETFVNIYNTARNDIQEVEIAKVPIHAGTIILTSKKIRGRVKITTTLPDGSVVKRFEQLDILLSLVTSTAVVHVRPCWQNYVCVSFFLLLFVIVPIWFGWITIVQLLSFTFASYFLLKLYFGNYFYVRIGVGGNDMKVRILKSERKIARELVGAIRKEKAEYELKAGM